MTSNLLQKLPILFTAVALYLGVAVSEVLPIIDGGFIYVSSFLLVAAAMLSFKWFKLQGYTFAPILFLAVFSIGIAAKYHSDNYKQAPHHFEQHLAKAEQVLVRVTNEPVERPKSYRISAEVEAVMIADSTIPTYGNLLLYVQKDATTADLQYGDLLIGPAKLKLLEEPKNPYQFNYKSYQDKQQIAYRTFWRYKQEQLLESGNGNWFWATIYSTQRQFQASINKYISSESSKAVMTALLLGKKDALDKDLYQDYANAGAIHLLAVSGLHVGIIYLIVSFLLGAFGKKPWERKVKTITLITTVILYAILTGLSPSVQRAAIMFSFLALGKLFVRKPRSYELLAASAIVVLLLDPNSLFQVGFQLSYAAVAGILVFQPAIASLWQPKYTIVNYFWELTAVSVAAQLATTPLSLYYFHQFPNYFLLTNSIAIPLVGIIILPGGLLLLATSNIEPVAFWIGERLDNFIQFLNTTISSINSLPYSLLENISISHVEVVLLYALITSAGLGFIKQKAKLLVIAFGVLMVLSITWSVKDIQQERQQNLFIYHTNKNTAVAINTGKQLQLFATEKLLTDTLGMAYAMKDHWIALGINEKKLHPLEDTLITYKLFKQGHFLQAGKKRIAIVDKSWKLPTVGESKLTVDYLLLTKNSTLKLPTIIQYIQPSLIILDVSNTAYRRSNWKEQAKQLNLPIYDITEEGALLVDL